MGFQVPLEGLHMQPAHWDCFSRDAGMPMNDIRILGVVVKLLFRPSMAVVKMSHFFSAGKTSPLLKSNLYPRKSNF